MILIPNYMAFGIKGGNSNDNFNILKIKIINGILIAIAYCFDFHLSWQRESGACVEFDAFAPALCLRRLRLFHRIGMSICAGVAQGFLSAALPCREKTAAGLP
jgi:hypothetical protein